MSDRSKKKQSQEVSDSSSTSNGNMSELIQKIQNIETAVNENNASLRSTIKDLILEMKDEIVKSVERKIEVIESSLFDVLKENENLKTEIKELKKEIEENGARCESRTVDINNVTMYQAGVINDYDQNSRQNNIRISGIAENETNETVEVTTQKNS